MPVITPTRDVTAIHEPAPVELWLNTQPQPYRGRHRGVPAIETEPPASTAR